MTALPMSINASPPHSDVDRRSTAFTQQTQISPFMLQRRPTRRQGGSSHPFHCVWSPNTDQSNNSRPTVAHDGAYCAGDKQASMKRSNQ